MQKLWQKSVCGGGVSANPEPYKVKFKTPSSSSIISAFIALL